MSDEVKTDAPTPEDLKVQALLRIGAATVRVIHALELGVPALQELLALRKIVQGG